MIKDIGNIPIQLDDLKYHLKGRDLTERQLKLQEEFDKRCEQLPVMSEEDWNKWHSRHDD